MPRYDASSAELFVFTFKEGALAAVAHDLKLKPTRFTLELEPASVTLEVDAASLVVVNAMKDGRDNPSGLPRLLHGEIEKNAANDVLEAKKFPSIRFVSTSLDATSVVGTLTLHGKSRELRGTRVGNTVELSFDQRDFGITPYSAMFGTLKVKPVVQVRIALK